jgi:predicted nucleotidyltransferase
MTVPATLDQVLEVLRARQPEARTLGLELVGVVGSLARGEASPESDADIIVQYHPSGLTFSRLFHFEQALEIELGRPVDLVFSESLRPERRAYIERDLVRL